MSIPGVDILGSKAHYSLSRPWLFEDFDQIHFYRVSEDEYEEKLALFKSGRYEYEIEDAVFDMGEHNRLLAGTKGEVEEIRKKQRVAQAEMDKIEKEMLERWAVEKEKNQIPMGSIEALLEGLSLYRIPHESSAQY